MSPVELLVEFADVEREPYVLYRDRKTKEAHSESLKVILNEVLHRRPHSEIYRGINKATDAVLALKLCYSEESMHHLDIEARNYDKFKELQGDVFPTCFGLFGGSTATGIPLKCLVLDYCGEVVPEIFDKLSLEYRLQILRKIHKIHQRGFRHIDTDEGHVVEQNNDCRILDLYNIEEHVCDFAGNSFEGERKPHVATFGCYDLFVQCSDMDIWDSGVVHLAGRMFPVEQFPSQDVIDQRTPVHGPLLAQETREELIKYFRQLRKFLDDGISLDEIPPFAEDKVLICGELFPAEQYPAQKVIDDFTPKTRTGGHCHHERRVELAAYLRDLKAAQETGDDIYKLTLHWPAMLKGDNCTMTCSGFETSKCHGPITCLDYWLYDAVLWKKRDPPEMNRACPSYLSLKRVRFRCRQVPTRTVPLRKLVWC